MKGKMRGKKILAGMISLILPIVLNGSVRLPVFASEEASAGGKILSVDFNTATGGNWLRDNGFIAKDASNVSNANVTFGVKDYPLEGNPNNKAMSWEGVGMISAASAEEKATWTDNINGGGSANKGKIYSFNVDGTTEYFFITDNGTFRLWYACDAGGNYLAELTNSKNQWFYYDEKGEIKPYRYKESSKPSITSAKPEVVQSSIELPVPDGGTHVGRYQVSMRFLQEGSGNISGSDFFGFWVQGKEGLISRNGMQFKDSEVQVDNAGTFASTNNQSCMLGKTANTVGILSDSAELSPFPYRAYGQWHTIMFDMNLDFRTYRIYFDGQPLFIAATHPATQNAVYSSEFKLAEYAADKFPSITIITPRLQVFADHRYVIDDIEYYYYNESHEKTIWNMISNGQTMSSVKNNLNFVSDFTVAGYTYNDVVWSSSNPAVISAKGSVKRQAKDAKVTLTASLQDTSISFDVTVPGKDGIYEIETLPGRILFEENFDGEEVKAGDSIRVLDGFTKISDAYSSDNPNVVYRVMEDTVSGSNPNNRVLGMTGNRSYIYLSPDEYEDTKTNGITIEYSGAQYRVKKYTFDGADYFIGYRGVNSGRDSTIYWFRADSAGTGVDVSGTNSRNYWFHTKNDIVKPYVYVESGKINTSGGVTGEVGGSSFTLPKPSMENVTEYDASFDFALPDNENVFNGDDTPVELFVGDDQFDFRKSFIFRHKADTKLKTDDGSEYAIAGTTNYIAKDSSVTKGSLTDTALLQQFAPVQDRQWRSILVKIDIEGGTYQICYDGRPIYFKADSENIYSSKLVLRTSDRVPDIVIANARLNTFYRHLPVYDNFVVKYRTDTVTNNPIKPVAAYMDGNKVFGTIKTDSNNISEATLILALRKDDILVQTQTEVVSIDSTGETSFEFELSEDFTADYTVEIYIWDKNIANMRPLCEKCKV